MGSFLGIAWENVAVGLLGGFVVSLALLITRRGNEWLIQKRFPVAGEYLTKFEDHAGAEKHVATAPATLRQRGKRVTGITTMDDREWILQGTLGSSGYIHGIYFARDPVDKGIGNFFLRVYNDRIMEGLWSGYDSVNDSITSGRYTFRPMGSKVTIRAALRTDALTLLRIADDQLGEGYVSEEFVNKLGNSDDGFARVAVDNGRVVGVALCLLQSADIARTMIKSPLPRHLKFAETIGVVKTVAVSPAYHGRGIGTVLTAACIEEFRQRGIQAIYSIAWKSKNGINIKGVLERSGFARISEVPNYWQEESLEDGFSCPSCGEPPCICAAVIYSLILDQVQAPPSISAKTKRVVDVATERASDPDPSGAVPAAIG